MSILDFCLESFGSEHSCHNNKNYIEIMLGSIPHQKFCFYHLPTRGRAGIKLGDAWYVSNVSIIFDCSMLLYYPFWMFMGRANRKHPGSQRNTISTIVTFCIREIPSWSLRRRSAEGEIDHGGLLHQHHSPSDELWVVYHRPSGP